MAAGDGPGTVSYTHLDVYKRQTLDCNIVLGGYLAQYLPPYLPELRRLTAALDPCDEDAGYVHRCHYPKHAASLGVALNFINRFLEQL